MRSLVRPVDRVGCYAPGGRARYPSTVLMCAAPARVAGVEEWCCACRPGPTAASTTPRWPRRPWPGSARCTASAEPRRSPPWPTAPRASEPVDVVVGPGQPLRRPRPSARCRGAVGVASAFAGPSEVVVVAGPETAARARRRRPHGPGRARPRRPGLAGHLGPGRPRGRGRETRVDGRGVATALAARVHLGERRLSPAWSTGAEAALAVSNVVAPEHLELLVDGAEDLLAARCGRPEPSSAVPGRRRASATTWPGPNHVLPTHRTARFGIRAAGRRLPAPHPRGDGLARGAGGPGPHVVDPGHDRGPPRPRRVRAASGMSGRSLPPPRPRGPDGIPLPTGRRGGPPQHQRVPVCTAPAVAGGVRTRGREDRLPPLPGPRRRRAARGDRQTPRGRAGGGLLRQRVQRGPPVTAARLRRDRPARSSPSSPPTRCTATSPA